MIFSISASSGYQVLMALASTPGGIGAFVKTYRVWKEEGAWPAWQGAGWFLLTLMLVCLSIPAAAMYAS